MNGGVRKRKDNNVSTGGLSKSRLERMHQVLAGYVERKEMPGLVALVSRHDDVHAETIGARAFGHPAPMERDTIFRFASITKPISGHWRMKQWNRLHKIGRVEG